MRTARQDVNRDRTASFHWNGTQWWPPYWLMR